MPARDRYTPTYLDRLGAEGVFRIRAAVMGVLTGTIAASIGYRASTIPPVPAHPAAHSLLIGIVAAIATTILVRSIATGAAASTLAFLQPSGASCRPEPEYSRYQALAARGDVTRAIAGYEGVIRAHPHETVARLHAAELYLRMGDARRAESLLREVQQLPARTDAHDLRASNRLVDLYLGPLADRESALRELRRLADAHGGTPVGEGAREAVVRMTQTSE
jgi:hypothetical protein